MTTVTSPELFSGVQVSYKACLALCVLVRGAGWGAGSIESGANGCQYWLPFWVPRNGEDLHPAGGKGRPSPSPPYNQHYFSPDPLLVLTGTVSHAHVLVGT